MDDGTRHGPDHPTHLHSAFEDPAVQTTTSAPRPSDPGGGSARPPPPRPRRRHPSQQPRHHSQPLAATTFPGADAPPGTSPLTAQAGIHLAASSPPIRGHQLATSASASPTRTLSPYDSPAGSPRLSRGSSARVSLRSPSPVPGRSSPASARGRRYSHSSHGFGSYSLRHHLSPSAATAHRTLDGAALAAACAAAPLNPVRTAATSYRSYGPSTQRGGLRRADESVNIHPDILDDLRALDDMEGGALLRPLLTQPPANDDDGGGSHAGGGGGGGGEGRNDGEEGDGGFDAGGGHVDEAATYEVKELLEAKPRDVLQFIEEEGVVKLAEFEVADGLVLKAFGNEPFLVMGQEHAEPPGLKDMWMERLSEGGKAQSTGWTSSLTVEAHVVNLYDAAAPGNAGLLRPLLARLRVHGCPPTVFALPAVQGVIALKWNTWARHFLFAEFVFYAAWLASFSVFTLLLEDGDDVLAPPAVPENAAPPPPPFQFGAAAAGGGGGAGLPVVRLLTSVVQAAAAALRPQQQSYGLYSGSGGLYGDVGELQECPAERFFNVMDWRALWGLLASGRGFLQLVTSTAAVAAMLPFAYMEVCTIVVQGLAWLNLFNLADVASYIFAILLWAVHIRCGSLPYSAWFSGALALQHVLLWSKLHYYARVLTPTRGGFNDTIRMVLGELRTFLVFVGLVMMGFAFAFYCLFRQDRDEFADFATLWHSFASMFAYMLQMFDYSVLYKSTHPVLAMLLFMAYELMVAVLLLNIMIALMTAAFARVSADEGLRYLIYKAEVIDELESTLPGWLMRPAWYPHFVHVLKVSPRSTYEINLNSVWSGMSTLQSSLMNAQQETRLRVEALESKMDVIDQKLSATVRLLASRLLTHSELAAALSVDDVAEAASDGSSEQDLDGDLDGEDGEPDPAKWRDADLDPALDEQAVPEVPEDDDEAVGAVAALLRGRHGGGGGGARTGSSRRGGAGSPRGAAAAAPASLSPGHGAYRSGGGGGYHHLQPSPRRLQSSRTQQSYHHHHYHAQPYSHHQQPPSAGGGPHHTSTHPSHATSVQLPPRNQSQGHGQGHHGAQQHGHDHGQGNRQAAPPTRGSRGASAATSNGPSRDPSVPHPGRTVAPSQPPSGARLHAFYSHGHGQGYHQQQQQQQGYHEHSRRRDVATPPPEPAGPPLGRTSVGGGGSGGSGGPRPVTAPPVCDRHESWAGFRSSGSGDGAAFAVGDSGGGTGSFDSPYDAAAVAAAAAAAPEGSVVLDMRRTEDRTASHSPMRTAARSPPRSPSWGASSSVQPPPPARADDTSGQGHSGRPYNYHRWFSTGGGSGGGDGSGGGGGACTAPVMASIAEHGSPSLAGSETFTDSSPRRRSDQGSGGKGR